MMWEELTLETSPVCSVLFPLACKTNNRNSFGDNRGSKVRQSSEWVRQV